MLDTMEIMFYGAAIKDAYVEAVRNRADYEEPDFIENIEDEEDDPEDEWEKYCDEWENQD